MDLQIAYLKWSTDRRCNDTSDIENTRQKDRHRWRRHSVRHTTRTRVHSERSGGIDTADLDDRLMSLDGLVEQNAFQRFDGFRDMERSIRGEFPDLLACFGV